VPSERRICIVGLDGVPVGLLRRLTDAGVMPQIGERIAAANLRSMRASLPEISSVSWTSFMTGAGPGEHGVYGFTDIDPGTYELIFPNFRQVEIPTLWDRLGRGGVSSVVLNQPATYPARRIPGALVSGFVAIDLSRAVQPLRHLGPLRRLDYRIDIDTGRSRHDHDWLLRDLYRTLETREAALWHLWESEPWQLMQVVVTGTDRLYHYLWDALEDPAHPRHQATLEYHRAVDAFVGRIYDRFAALQPRAEHHFWMLSDHGFCAIEQEVQLNAWLRRQDWLRLRGDGTRVADITGGSMAFALDPGRFYIHRASRFARGSVRDERLADLKHELANRLLQLRYDGRPVIREVFDGAEIYQGARQDRAPDLVALAHPGFDLKASPAAEQVFGRTDLVGMHTYDDAFFLAPSSIEGDLWIGQVAEILEKEFAS